MLARAHRMVDPADFRRAMRRGRRAATPQLVVHYATGQSEESPLVGFVAPKRELAHAVDRNRVRRRLRHLMRAYVPFMPPGSSVVIRLRRDSREASYATLGTALRRALIRVGADWAAGPVGTGTSAGGCAGAAGFAGRGAPAQRAALGATAKEAPCAAR